MCAILVIIKGKDAAREGKAYAKVFISNSLCYCEFLVSGPYWCFVAAGDMAYSLGVLALIMHTVL